MATPRRINATSSSTTAGYRAENAVAYQPGKAANMAAAATTSHTSLPSHTGPMVWTTSQRPSSSRPMTLCSAPTPKSKPSSTRKPVHSAVMTMNQNVVMTVLSR
jgi:hypothetical protein